MKRVVALVLALALLPIGLTACGAPNDQTTNDGAASEEAAPSSTSGTTYIDSDGELDADAIARELEAIERELDETALPDDSDFSEIEDGL